MQSWNIAGFLFGDGKFRCIQAAKPQVAAASVIKLEKFFTSEFLGYPAVLHEDHAVHNAGEEIHAMLRYHQGFALFLEPAQQGGEVLNGLGVKVGGGFVEQQDGCVLCVGLRAGDFLQLPTRQAPQVPARQVADAHVFQRLCAASTDRVWR